MQVHTELPSVRRRGKNSVVLFRGGRAVEGLSALVVGTASETLSEVLFFVCLNKLAFILVVVRNAEGDNLW